MRYTASQFKNEDDVLEIRLETIGHLFDKIVIGEATVDQRGNPKPLNFDLSRYERWSDKLVYVVIDDMPGGTAHEDDVRRERHQREALLRGMPDLNTDDLVYVSDLDEIPTEEALYEGFEEPQLRFGMDLHVYALNWRWLDRGCRIGTLGAVLRGESILQRGVCGAVLWDSSVRGRKGVSGWHLTYQGGVKAIRSKITGMMDKYEALVMPGVDPNIILTDEWIETSIRTGADVFGRTYRPTEWVGLDQMPPCVQERPERYQHMMVKRPADQDLIESQPRCTCGGVFNSQRELGHFSHCALIGNLPDMRNRPRALDV